MLYNNITEDVVKIRDHFAIVCSLKIVNESPHVVKNEPEYRYKYFRKYVWSENAKNNYNFATGSALQSHLDDYDILITYKYR